ncbi:pyridoxine 5'-phosphate synthase [bacterium]|nr:pyridoxine 5'-phosphate synthase [bacterium]
MRFGFYINPAARLRDPEKPITPEPAVIASLAISAGADMIVAGWIPSGWQIGERELRLTSELIHSDLVILTPLKQELVEQTVKFRPHSVILVASGWDGTRDFRHVQPEVDAEDLSSVSAAYRAAGVGVSALVEPDMNALKNIARCGLNGVVIDASEYAAAGTDEEAEAALHRLEDAALASHKFGLITGAGHGLDYNNVAPLAAIKYFEEVYIGRAIVARALLHGIERAVTEMISTFNRYK